MSETDDGWSAVASEWAELWGATAVPARHAVITATGITRGTRVLDIGCGSGEFLALIEPLGAAGSGADPAPGMVEVARGRARASDIRLGSFEELPWPESAFDVVTAFNALQFAEDVADALAEAVRVTVPGGLIAICGWAEAALNDLATLDAAVAAAHGEEPAPDGELRVEGGIERVLRAGGLELVASGAVDVPWLVADADALVRGVLLGEDADGLAAIGPAVVGAASPFRRPDGSYELANTFRYVVGRVPVSEPGTAATRLERPSAAG